MFERENNNTHVIPNMFSPETHWKRSDSIPSPMKNSTSPEDQLFENKILSPSLLHLSKFSEKTRRMN